MKNPPANTIDYPPIAICFNEPEIAFLFAELVEAHGFQSAIYEDPESTSTATHIITEPNLFDQLPEWAQKNCLVISDKSEERKKAAVTLLRPLEEEKIETAFARFLPQQ
jgi:hypothetical protein